MELWASGFNAWNQLQFDGELQAEPRDLSEFSCVLKDQQVELLKTSLSATVGKLLAIFSSLARCPFLRDDELCLLSSYSMTTRENLLIIT
jgi:hypothetical protein